MIPRDSKGEPIRPGMYLRTGRTQEDNCALIRVCRAGGRLYADHAASGVFSCISAPKPAAFYATDIYTWVRLDEDWTGSTPHI